MGLFLKMKIRQQIAIYLLPLKQLRRLFETLDIFRFLIVVAGVAGALFAFFSMLSRRENLEPTVVLMLLTLLFLQVQRKDKTFLRINFNNHRKILFLQYLLLSLPVLGFLIYFLYWQFIIILFGGLFILPFIDVKIKNSSLNTKIQRCIPDAAFEWKSGLRTYFYLLTTTWILGLAFSFLTGAVPLALFILGTIPIKFFETGEPLSMLLASEKPPAKLIFDKFRMHALIFSIIGIPLAALFIVFHPSLWYIVVVEFVIFLSIHLYFLLLKYAMYQPNQKPGGVEVFSGIGVTGMILPIFLPIVWLLSIRFYFRSIINLKQYLHDFD